MAVLLRLLSPGPPTEDQRVDKAQPGARGRKRIVGGTAEEGAEEKVLGASCREKLTSERRIWGSISFLVRERGTNNLDRSLTSDSTRLMHIIWWAEDGSEGVSQGTMGLENCTYSTQQYIMHIHTVY